MCQKWRVAAQRQRYLTTTTSASSLPLPCFSKIRSAIVCAAPPPASAGRDRALDAVRDHHQQVAALQRHRRRAHARHPVAEHAAEHERDLLAQLRPRADEPRVHVADPRPRQRLALEVEPGDGHDHAAGVEQRLVAGLQQFLRAPHSACARTTSAAGLGGVRGFGPVPEPVDQARQRARGGRDEDRNVARARLALDTALPPPRGRAPRATLDDISIAGPLDQRDRRALPGRGLDSNSSTSRRAPGSPRPSPPPVV